MDLQIDEASSNDIDGMNALFAEEDAHHRNLDPGMFRRIDGSLPPRPVERLMGLIESETACLLVARSGDSILGLGSVSLSERTGHPVFVDRKFAVLEDLVVRQEHRRRGIGTALVRRAERWAASVGADSLEVGVWPSNGGAQRLYERLGYVPRFIKMTRRLDGGWPDRSADEVDPRGPVFVDEHSARSCSSAQLRDPPSSEPRPEDLR